MNTDTDAGGTIWIGADDGLDGDITLPFPEYSGGVDVPVVGAAPAAEVYAKQEAYDGLGLYIAFNVDNNAEYVILRTDMAHMLDGFRVR